MDTQTDVSPVRADGSLKSGEEVFLEVFNQLKSKGEEVSSSGSGLSVKSEDA